MYSPPYNQVGNLREVAAFMRANSFALVVTGTGGALHASHLPVTVEERGDRLAIHSHMAKNNPQWQEFFDDDILVVFSGPHAYVSPSWYEQKEKERVPTWNYAAVHAYGAVKLVQDREAKHAAQRKLVAEMDPQWLPKFDALRPQYVAQMLEGIVTFDIEVSRIETRWKLSQNRGRREMELIADRLEQSADSVERALAALTRGHLVGD